MDLFVYGTLMVPRVMRAVCGHAAPGVDAVLHGYCRRRVRHEVYPAIFPCGAESVPGLVYLGLDAQQARALDRFEGNLYVRCPVQVEIAGRTRRADAYVWSLQSMARVSEAAWRLEDFLDDGLDGFLEGYPGFASPTMEPG